MSSPTTKSRAVNLNCTLAGHAVYATPTGLRLGSKDKVIDVLCNGRLAIAERVQILNVKGELRRVRKALARLGRHDLVQATLS